MAPRTYRTQAGAVDSVLIHSPPVDDAYVENDWVYDQDEQVLGFTVKFGTVWLAFLALPGGMTYKRV